jgi:hypothetical protein
MIAASSGPAASAPAPDRMCVENPLDHRDERVGKRGGIGMSMVGCSVMKSATNSS